MKTLRLAITAIRAKGVCYQFDDSELISMRSPDWLQGFKGVLDNLDDKAEQKIAYVEAYAVRHSNDLEAKKSMEQAFHRYREMRNTLIDRGWKLVDVSPVTWQKAHNITKMSKESDIDHQSRLKRLANSIQDSVRFNKQNASTFLMLAWGKHFKPNG